MRNIEERKNGILIHLFYFNFDKINGLCQKTFLFFSNKIEEVKRLSYFKEK